MYGYYRDQNYGANVPSFAFDAVRPDAIRVQPRRPDHQGQAALLRRTRVAVREHPGQRHRISASRPTCRAGVPDPRGGPHARSKRSMTAKGMPDVGTPGYANIPNPLLNMFARLDYRINDTHRAVVRYNYSEGERLRQQNNRGATAAVYSGNFHTFDTWKIAPVFQLFSVFGNGSSNELFIGYNRARNRRTPESPYPQIQITGVPLATGSGTNGTIIAGADQFSQGNELDTDTYELTNNFNFQRGNHTITLGTRNEYVDLRNLFNQSSFGVWQFRYCTNTATITCNPALGGMDSLAAGNPQSFRRAIILQDGGNVYFRALQSAWYAQDQWQVNAEVRDDARFPRRHLEVPG